jgi:hypothetical protein
MQERLAIRLGLHEHFALLDCPFEAVALREAMYWHPALTNDPGHTWFRAVVERAGASFQGE